MMHFLKITFSGTSCVSSSSYSHKMQQRTELQWKGPLATMMTAEERLGEKGYFHIFVVNIDCR